jgi:hypothetical protein
MADVPEPVTINGQEIITQAQAQQLVSTDQGFEAMMAQDGKCDPEATRAAVKNYAENLWKAGKLLTNDNTFIVTPDGISKAVSICAQGVGHTESVTTDASNTKPFVPGMFGSAPEAAALQQKIHDWLDHLNEKAKEYQAVLQGVSDGTKEIQSRAEATDSSWARGFHRTVQTSATAAPTSAGTAPDSAGSVRK